MYIYKTHSTEVVCAFILGSRFSDHSQDGFEKKKKKYINIKPCCMNIRYKHTQRTELILKIIQIFIMHRIRLKLNNIHKQKTRTHIVSAHLYS